MTDTPEFTIEHITDLHRIPYEHIDNAMESLRMAIAQLKLLHDVADSTGDKIDMRQVCPRIVIRCDNVAKSTATFPGGDQFIVRGSIGTDVE